MRDESRSALQQQILEQASDWFVEFRVGDVDSHARARFDKWLRTSPEHIRSYIEIAKTYVDLPGLIDDAHVDADALIARAQASANVVPFGREPMPWALPPDHDASRAVASRGRRARNGAIAAALIVAGTAAALFFGYALRYPTYATDIGESRTVTLADGSTVDLNARSQIRVRFSPGERDIDLIAGQALFEVAKDASRPFVVHSGAAVVRAVGTQFDVYRRESGTTVTVIEGRVAVSPWTAPAVRAPAYVSAGEQIIVSSRAMTAPKLANVEAATAWIRHRLVFSASPLTEVVEAFNRYNARQIVIQDEVLEGLRVSGVYTSTDPASFIRFLREQPGIEVTEDADAVHVSSK